MAAWPLDTILASKTPAPSGPEYPAWDSGMRAFQPGRSPWPWTTATTKPVVDMEPPKAQPDPSSGAACERWGREGCHPHYTVGVQPRLEQRLSS